MTFDRVNCEDVKPLLNARMDDEIEATQRARLDLHLETCSSCASELEELAGVQHAIRDGAMYHKAPAHLRDQVKFALRGAAYLDGGARRTNWRAWGSVAAAAAVVALVSGPLLLNARNQQRAVAEEIMSAHQRALVGRMVDVVSSDQHTVKPWFNGKLPFSPPVTDLVSEGFPLAGGRLDYVGGHPVAALVYRRRLHQIDVFVSPSASQQAPPSHFERNGFNEISWTRNNFTLTAVSELNAAELATFSGLLRAR
jgi:anti-sigma factor RsiW